MKGWPWHVHVFFTLGGYSLAAPMNPSIEKKLKYFKARFLALYPMYAIALAIGFMNLIYSCRPSTFRAEFNWDSQPDDLYVDSDPSKGLSPLFCEGTPVFPESYWASLFSTLIVYITGLVITPLWPFTWWMVSLFSYSCRHVIDLTFLLV